MVATREKRQIIDITDEVAAKITGESGAAIVFARHTTAAVTTADLDPGTDLDFLDFLNSLVPSIDWRHPHDPSHAPDHLLASLIGPGVTVPFMDEKLLLGTWQRIILVEFDGPREREIMVAIN